MTEALARIRRRCDVTADGCWQQRRSIDHAGYGHTSYQGRSWLTHRLTYTLVVGPIPDGLEVDHLCRNRGCCNPEHLDAVTRAVNAERTPAGLRGQNVARIESAKTHCPRGHEYDAENTYTNDKGHRWCRACRRERYAERKAS